MTTDRGSQFFSKDWKDAMPFLGICRIHTTAYHPQSNGLAERTIQTDKPISGRVDRASATETIDSGSIPGRVKPKTIKIVIHSFPA